MIWSITEKLDTLFDCWSNTFPEVGRSRFHRDGVVCEDKFVVQPRRVVYVLAEPNDRGGSYYAIFGADLRVLWAAELNRKAFNRNIGRWTRLLLDECTTYEDISASDARRQFHRIALMNIKKIPGAGQADYREVAEHARANRAYLLEQLAIIAPDIVVACGYRVRRILIDAVFQQSHCIPIGQRSWHCAMRLPNVTFVLLETYHPSSRDDRGAHQRLLSAAVAAGLVGR